MSRSNKRVCAAAILAGVSVTGYVHNGTLATPSASTIILSRMGIPEFAGRPNQCPSGNGDGTVQRSWPA